jgi:acetoacetate decarboxylase
MLVGVLDYGDVWVGINTMGRKHKPLDRKTVQTALAAPNFLLKIIPHVGAADVRTLNIR